MKVLAIIESIGLGHAVRSLEALKEFKKNGCEVKAIASNSAASFLVRKGVPTFDIPLSINLTKKEGRFDMGRTILENIRLSNIAALARIREVLKKEKPDGIIIDTSLIGLIAANTARRKNTPLLFISNDNTYQSGIKESGKGQQHNPGIIDNFVQTVVDSYIVPDFPPPYTISEYNLFLRPKMNFAGPLSWALHQKPDKRAGGIFLTQGKSGVCSEKIARLLGRKAPAARESGYTERFLKSEIIIHHGGHTTAMDSILLGKPQVVIPVDGYAERENNGRKIEQLRLGRMVYEAHLDKNTIEYAIEEARQYKRRIAFFSRYARSYDAPKRICSIFESLCRK